MPDPPGLIPAIGYVRVSMKREEMLSPQLQQAAIGQWARANRRRITDWVIDLDATGRNFTRKVRGAIERVVQGDAQEIVVYRYDRWGRNARDALANVVRVETAGGALISATEPLDAETAIGRYNRTNAFALAEMQSDIIGENWRGVREHRIGNQIHPYGRKRFGYTRLGRVPDETDPQRTRRDPSDPEPERYVPDPELGPVLAGMYLDYIRGDGGVSIAMGLNRQAVPNAGGRLWSGRTVLDTLDSGFGAGLLRLHDPACRCASPTRCRNRVLVKGRHEAVITQAQWQAYLQRREGTRTTPARHRNPVYPLSGIVFCGHCGAAMTGAKLSSAAKRKYAVLFRCGRQRHYGDCPGRPAVPLPVLLAAVFGELEKISEDLDAAAAQVKARTRKARDTRSVAERLGREIAAVDRRLVNLALQAAEHEPGTLPPASWQTAAEELKAQRATLEQQMAAVNREVVAVSADPLPVVTGVLEGWDTLPPARVNQMLRLLIRRVVVWRTAEPARNARGHWRPQQVRIEVVPIWVADDTPPAGV